jgi:hypothetical protein
MDPANDRIHEGFLLISRCTFRIMKYLFGFTYFRHRPQHQTTAMAMQRPHHHSARCRRLRHYYILLSLYLLAWQRGPLFAKGEESRKVGGGERPGHHDIDDEGVAASRSMMMIPEETLRPFGEYPDLLHLGDDRQSFHPIVKFPYQCWRQQRDGNDQENDHGKFACAYSDYTVPRPYTNAQLLAKDIFDRKTKRWPLLPRLRRWWRTFRIPPPYDRNKRYVGRYDEDRIGLYETALFGKTTDDKATTVLPRTVHVGIDLALYVGSPVYSFDHNGVVESVGYNPAHGDYGHVVVVRYATSSPQQHHDHGNNSTNDDVIQYYYVLYGHLDSASSTKRHRVGDSIPKGSIIGWLGDAYENGGTCENTKQTKKEAKDIWNALDILSFHAVHWHLYSHSLTLSLSLSLFFICKPLFLLLLLLDQRDRLDDSTRARANQYRTAVNARFAGRRNAVGSARSAPNLP